MAERSFKREVQDLRLGAGETFTGEGILAITKALLESGVGYVGGYQGAPISHLMDVLADAQDLLGELGVRYEANASEAAAAAMLAASVHYPIRGAVTFKGAVGVNVASDALANLASSGVTGGALVIVGEDYGEGSSIMQERSHAFAMKSQFWLLDPRPNLPSIVQAVKQGFELSEASNTPVMLMVRIRSCHVTGQFECADNLRPPLSVRDALSEPRRDFARVVLPPMSYQHERDKVENRWPAAERFITEQGLNEVFGPETAPVGLVVQGGMYNGVIRALQRLGLADIEGRSAIPLYVLNVTYPLVKDEFLAFARGKDALLVVEEGQPEFIEQGLAAMLHRARSPVTLQGKGLFPMAGEYTGQIMLEGIAGFLKDAAPQLLPGQVIAPNAPPPEMPDLSQTVPIRPPGFCTGCPERPIFAAMKLVEQELGKHQITGDIGCHLFAALPPFEIGGSTMGYGLGPASNAAFDGGGARRAVSFIGDGGFWHNGLSSSIGNMVFNRSDSVAIVVDNYYSAATGGQDVLSSRAKNPSKATGNPISRALEGVGVKWVRQIDRTYDVGHMRDTIREALTTDYDGPKLIVASSECMLNRQRREKPLRAQAIREGRRVEAPRFGVDEDICTGDHACIRLSGCPSLSLKVLDDPLRDDPVASIDQTCVGCGNCGEVADAAVLCPSFYRADLVHNPGRWERLLAGWRSRIITWLQDRRARRQLDFGEAS
ncbi:indolepyruvate ferredoxin oxidoreductase subunit alpha [Ruegeria pomeroyi]|uniref:Indolepyruvate oxidoreductase, IorA subunit, putative n=2 Tax=Ruegeria pomeroyi TaxID=89184 RepID=Q5LTF5_RUEPO|nr:indolepyruvate ferredoxin oxidoreductase subunit alpha [Ruegeria pomeroyi]AAV94746.1 indolepyruvate oxidoreductase, IorA subunit, putative [Ruegeria pomeroyi DSS-3]NVK95876.1 indolepyruvate ferredoxin oxidoreductase subunit alpha [Ruegeria pomeroyi]NVL00145.1 indolepyruvate ferredoxin oxidoreductase subunit alpha [Ruegeria pomeroyi]QWV08327.1 indolepyruvate ferredoxin oxidoreductase subunit alpha [Ruegeria pomeroyi]